MANIEVAHERAKQRGLEEHTRPGRTYQPSVDILETDQGLRLWADMPGVDQSSIDVELVDDVITIRGRVATTEYENLRPVYTEYNVGNYEARFRLSSTIDGARISAKLANGVLEIDLPKVEAAKPRRIEIS
jgi:HSP20 family molecular chaperone IbpA